MVSRKMAANSTAVHCSARAGTKNRKDTEVPSNAPSTRNITPEKRMPNPMPTTRDSAASTSVSRKMMWAMCRFSIPKILYRPSSFFRRFIIKLLV